ncbi:hypothetical protein Goshw_008202, partial [Gossypium schwendimanii]|nr:hypothetical protein [Gossypium schwendimanii]
SLHPWSLRKLFAEIEDGCRHITKSSLQSLIIKRMDGIEAGMSRNFNFI